MNGDFIVFGPAYVLIDSRLEQFLGAGAARMAAEVAGPLRAALVLYVMLYGFAILRGAIVEPVMDFAVRSIKLALITMLAVTPAYGEWVAAPLFHQMPDAIGRAIAGAASSSPGAAFDQFFARSAYLGEKAAREATPLNWVPLVVGAAVFLVGALAAALGFGITMLAKVALALLLALGPAFLACALFDASRRYFFGWLGQAVNYLVLFALIIAIFQLILAVVADQWATIEGHDPVVGGLMFIALCLLGAIFFLQTPAIAAGIAGGASAGLADFGNAISPGRGSGRRVQGAASTPSPLRRPGGSIQPVSAR